MLKSLYFTFLHKIDIIVEKKDRKYDYGQKKSSGI